MLTREYPLGILKEVAVAGARSAATAISVHKMSLPQFLSGNSPEALPYKGLTLPQVKHPTKGYTVTAIPLDIIISFWSYHAAKGNQKAKSLLEGAAKSNFRDTALSAVEWGIKYEQGDRNSFYQNATEEEIQLTHQAVHYNRLVREMNGCNGYLDPGQKASYDRLSKVPAVVTLAAKL